MPPLPKGEASALPDSASANREDALAPPLGELAKPKALTERVSLFTKKAATHRSVQQLLYYKVLLFHLLCQKCRRHVHRLELGGIGLGSAVLRKQAYTAGDITRRNDGHSAQQRPG